MTSANNSNSADSVLVITTGGTIDKVYFDAKSDYKVGESVVAELLQQAHVEHAFEIESLMRKDSLELDDDDRQLIFQRVVHAPQQKVIVTHGTDTMTDTARVLGGIDNKIIVLTGALAPARFAQSDATFNVGMAFAAVQSLKSGVYIVMNGQVFRGDDVRKDRDKNRFIKSVYGDT